MKEISFERVRFPDEYFLNLNKKGDLQNENKVLENLKLESEKKVEEAKKTQKVDLESVKKSMMSEEDLRLLLLIFGSRGNTTLLDGVIEKMKKNKKL